MKKLSILILSLVLLFCFVSCEKDKSEEMIANYEAFVKAYEVCNNTFYSLQNQSSSSSGSGVTNVAEKYGEISVSTFRELYASIYGESKINIREITGGSGTYEYTNDDTVDEVSDITVTYNNVVLKYKYEDTNGTLKDDGEMKITTGTYKTKIIFIDTSSKRAGTTNRDVKCNLTIDGTTYEITYTKKGSTFTSATVNGNEVEVRLLNANN